MRFLTNMLTSYTNIHFISLHVVTLRSGLFARTLPLMAAPGSQAGGLTRAMGLAAVAQAHASALLRHLRSGDCASRSWKDGGKIGR